MLNWIREWFRDVKLGAKRSSGWRKVRNDFVKANPTCAVCGTKKDLEVHHIKDFSNYPELELINTNLLTLCHNEHFLFGHYKNWRLINKTIMEDTKTWRRKLKRARNKELPDDWCGVE